MTKMTGITTKLTFSTLIYLTISLSTSYAASLGPIFPLQMQRLLYAASSRAHIPVVTKTTETFDRPANLRRHRTRVN